MSLLDAYRPKLPDKSRLKNLDAAYSAITGKKKRKRSSPPDGKHAAALYEYFRRELQNYEHQLSEEHGGPTVRNQDDEERYKEKSRHAITQEIGNDWLDVGPNVGKDLYERIEGFAGIKDVIEDKERFYCAMRARFHLYDREKEEELKRDLCNVADLLSKYGIPLSPVRPLWRLGTTDK